VTAANDRMRRGLAAADWPLYFRSTWPASCIGSAPKLRVRTSARSRILDRLHPQPEQAIHPRRVGTAQIRRKSKRNMQPGCSRDCGGLPPRGRHACRTTVDHIDRRASDVLDHARVDGPMRAESCPASPTSGGRSASTPHTAPRARSVYTGDHTQREVETAVNRTPLLKQCAPRGSHSARCAIESPCSYGAAAGVAICGKRDMNARDSPLNCEVLWRAGARLAQALRRR
jgi:hypothetical protein